VLAPYSSNNSTIISPSNGTPLRDDIAFVRGDELTLKYLWKNIVYTPERPIGEDANPMYHSSETVPEGVTPSDTALVAPWVQRYWHAEVRSIYISTLRYLNGWAPWYGTRPNWVWWQAASLKGVMTVTAEYSSETDKEGTVVTAVLPSIQSAKIYPSPASYRWDLESAKPVAFDDDLNPTSYESLKTWVNGRATVLQDFTLNTKIGQS